MNIFKVSWNMAKLLWANNFFIDYSSWSNNKVNTEPLRIVYLFVIPTFIIILICLLIYTLFEITFINKIVEWLFSKRSL